MLNRPCVVRFRGHAPPAGVKLKRSAVRASLCTCIFPIEDRDSPGCHMGHVEGRFARRANRDAQPARNYRNGAMRISGGTARGITLAVPKGDAVRPATDGMRQSVFSSLGTRVPGARFLDLFAGSGAYGLEAVSRGAAGGIFVEKNPKAIACLRQNIAAVCKSSARDPAGLSVLPRDVRGLSSQELGALDLVFIDPPYEIIAQIADGLFAELTTILDPATEPLIVFEMPGEIELRPVGWTCVKRLGKGARQPTVSFFKRS